MHRKYRIPTLGHLATLSDDTGVIQHAVEDLPNRSTGYCTDDVSRAYIVALMRLSLDAKDAVAERLASIYLSFLHDAQLEDGRFHNFMSYDRRWLDEVGTQDSVGRALWSLGFAMRFARKPSWRRVSKRLFDRGMQSLSSLEWTRSRAYAMLGLAHACASPIAGGELPLYRGALRGFAEELKASYMAARRADWHWFEDLMTYDNARLSEAMIRAGLAVRDDAYLGVGLESLGFYAEVTTENGVHVPVGNDGWYKRGGRRARYAQQPLEAVAFVDASFAAYDAAGDARWMEAAQSGLDWYYGRNSKGAMMVREGGCYDGLEEEGINANMGAESTLAFLAGAYTMALRRDAELSVAR